MITIIFGSTKLYAKDASLHQQIQSVQSQLSQDTKQQTTLTDSLKDSEKNISALTIKINTLNKTTHQQLEQITQLEQQKIDYQKILKQQKATLAKLIQANYLLQRQGKFGLYLDSFSAKKANRYLHYYRALDQNLIHAIDEQQKTLQKLSSVLAQIRDKHQELGNNLTETKQQKQKIAQQQETRQNAISKLDKAIKTNQQKLAKLQHDQQQLSNIVQQLKPRSASTSTPRIKRDFAEQKHKLSWPIKGKLHNLYWTPMAHSSIKWQGDLISAHAGTPVQSIYAGKVIYADWLRGYGLLIIVDHGNGYMSLYGRNHTLNRKVGDYVNTGDMIATVGNSGGFKTPGLYFEIRHNGSSMNPKLWMK